MTRGKPTGLWFACQTPVVFTRDQYSWTAYWPSVIQPLLVVYTRYILWQVVKLTETLFNSSGGSSKCLIDRVPPKSITFIIVTLQRHTFTKTRLENPKSLRMWVKGFQGHQPVGFSFMGYCQEVVILISQLSIRMNNVFKFFIFKHKLQAVYH